MAYDNPKQPSLWGQGGVSPQANGRGTISTSGGQGNVGNNLILEGTAAAVLRADGNTTSANSLGLSTKWQGSGGTPNAYGLSRDTSGTVEAGTVEYMTNADLNGKQLLMGEDAVGGTVVSIAGTTFPIYANIANGTDNLTIEGTVPQNVLVQQIDSSSATTTPGTLPLRIDGYGPQSNATQYPAPATTVGRSYLVTLVSSL